MQTPALEATTATAPNRAQRRAAKAAKAKAITRAKRLGREGCDNYTARAKRKSKGVVFRGFPTLTEDGKPHVEGVWHFPVTVMYSDRHNIAKYLEKSPLHWRITASARFRYPDGEERTMIEEFDVGQVLLLGELDGEWARARAAAAAQGNPRYLVSELIELRPLV